MIALSSLEFFRMFQSVFRSFSFQNNICGSQGKMTMHRTPSSILNTQTHITVDSVDGQRKRDREKKTTARSTEDKFSTKYSGVFCLVKRKSSDARFFIVICVLCIRCERTKYDDTFYALTRMHAIEQRKR